VKDPEGDLFEMRFEVKNYNNKPESKQGTRLHGLFGLNINNIAGRLEKHLATHDEAEEFEEVLTI